MFFLSEIEHTLRLPPDKLNESLDVAIKGQLESIFLDKVIDKIGLCVTVYDIRSIDGGFIFPGDGASTYTVKFRLVMFRPFVGEIISARVKESTTKGLKLSLGFFDDIYIELPFMFSPNRYESDPKDPDRVTWIWNFMDEDYVVDGLDEVRFKVHRVSYPPLPLEQPEEKDVKPFAPMVVYGTLDMDGLGPGSWWE